MKYGIKGRGVAAAALAIGLLTLNACSADTFNGSSDKNAAQITILVDNNQATLQIVQPVVDAFMKANSGIKVTVETRPQGTDGDNVVKTKLATGDMSDLFWYNSGSLLQALAPEKNLVPLTSESYMGNVDQGFKSSVTFNGQVYGAPGSTATGGGILYNKSVYQQLGLSVPKTWADFMANNAKIKAAGIDPVIQSYADTWTSQLLVLADYHNVAAADPTWDQKYTANDPSAKFAKDPALKGFQRLDDVHKAGYFNKDFASMKYDQALTYLDSGKGAQYPMLTFALSALITADAKAAQNIGFFGQPGDDAATNGMTLWEPAALYIPKTTTGAKLDAAKKLIAYFVSPEGCAAAFAAQPPSGPSVVKGCALPSSVPAAVSDMQAYVDAGKSTPALEFLSAVKGPNLEKLTVEVGSGITSAADGASRYDQDVKAQAQQLGLKGW